MSRQVTCIMTRETTRRMLMLVSGQSLSCVPRPVPAQTLAEAVTTAKLAAVMSEAIRADLQSLKSRVVPVAVDGPLVGALLRARERIR